MLATTGKQRVGNTLGRGSKMLISKVFTSQISTNPSVSENKEPKILSEKKQLGNIHVPQLNKQIPFV